MQVAGRHGVVVCSFLCASEQSAAIHDSCMLEQSEKEEVTIKRMIGLKKDEYFVDGKHVTWVLCIPVPS